MTKQQSVKVAQSTLHIMAGAAIAAGLLISQCLPADSQVGRPAPLEDLQTKDGSDFFNGRSNSPTGSVMNFIQNAIIGTPRSLDEFRAEQQENFNDAAAQFRKQQAEQLRKKPAQPTDALVAPLPTPATPN